MTTTTHPALSLPTSLAATILARLSRDPQAADFDGGTQKLVGDRALDFLALTVPHWRLHVLGKTVLDYGCGLGHQAVQFKAAGASQVIGFDPASQWTIQSPIEGVTFTSEPPTSPMDTVISLSTFEHFAEPEQELARMCALARRAVIIAWAESWYSHSGSHMNFFTKVPWVNLLFPEAAVMQVRSRYRADGATSYTACGHGGAVNKMTLARFERAVRASGWRVTWLSHRATKGLPLVTRLPVLRELLTGASSVVLERP